MLTKYREHYDGEFVLTSTTIRNGEKDQTREWVPNPISNQHVSNYATVIGSDNNKEWFDHEILQNHRGGILGTRRMQTYGCNEVWRNTRLDFYVTRKPAELEDIKVAGYHVNNIVYTTVRQTLKNPGSFYVVPHAPAFDELALAVYLAAFDGHKEIFLLGYNKDTQGVDRDWVQQVSDVMKSYRNCKFYLVGPTANLHEGWRVHANVECLTFRNFITHCDI